MLSYFINYLLFHLIKKLRIKFKINYFFYIINLIYFYCLFYIYSIIYFI